MHKYIRDIAKGNLFKDELFIIPNEASLNLEGSFEFPLLFIVNESTIEEHKIFINSILKQIPNDLVITLDNIGVVNLKDQTSSVLSIINSFKPTLIFTWDTANLLSGCPYNESELVYLGNTGIIQLPAIATVKESKPHKAALWQGMKTFYNIP